MRLEYNHVEISPSWLKNHLDRLMQGYLDHDNASDSRSLFSIERNQANGRFAARSDIETLLHQRKFSPQVYIDAVNQVRPEFDWDSTKPLSPESFLELCELLKHTVRIITGHFDADNLQRLIDTCRCLVITPNDFLAQQFFPGGVVDTSINRNHGVIINYFGGYLRSLFINEIPEAHELAEQNAKKNSKYYNELVPKLLKKLHKLAYRQETTEFRLLTQVTNTLLNIKEKIKK